jgi:hypothetical protein
VLAPLKKVLPAKDAILKLAEKAQQGSASHTDLVKLRDLINERSAELREKGEGGKSSQLSATNRLVRRLERAKR